MALILLIGRTDVQLTRDLVPVIYHDLSLSESGTDIPIHDLSLEQVSVDPILATIHAQLSKFLHTGRLPSTDSQHISGLKETNARLSLANSNCRKPRSQSLTSQERMDSHLIRDRLKYTVDFKNKGFKPNTRGDFVQGPLTTLEELLTKLPESIHFNIEISMSHSHCQKSSFTLILVGKNTLDFTKLPMPESHILRLRSIRLSTRYLSESFKPAATGQ